MFHFETILIHHVQIEAIPMVQMAFGCFSLGIAWQLGKKEGRNIGALMTSQMVWEGLPQSFVSPEGQESRHYGTRVA